MGEIELPMLSYEATIDEGITALRKANKRALVIEFPTETRIVTNKDIASALLERSTTLAELQNVGFSVTQQRAAVAFVGESAGESESPFVLLSQGVNARIRTAHEWLAAQILDAVKICQCDNTATPHRARRRVNEGEECDDCQSHYRCF